MYNREKHIIFRVYYYLQLQAPTGEVLEGNLRKQMWDYSAQIIQSFQLSQSLVAPCKLKVKWLLHEFDDFMLQYKSMEVFKIHSNSWSLK
jgi:hypothetical protein